MTPAAPGSSRAELFEVVRRKRPGVYLLRRLSDNQLFTSSPEPHTESSKTPRSEPFSMATVDFLR